MYESIDGRDTFEAEATVDHELRCTSKYQSVAGSISQEQTD